jgi:hypothetical protein
MSPRKLSAKSDLIISRDAKMDAAVFTKTRIPVKTLFDDLIGGGTIADFASRLSRFDVERACELLRRISALIESGELVV